MSVEEFNKKLKKENKLYQHLLESGEIKTDDPDEFDAWLERNEEDYRETDGTTAEEV